MEATNGYWVLRILNSQVCCLLKCGQRVTPIMPNSDCVKRFATLNEAWEACDEIKAEGMHPYFVRLRILTEQGGATRPADCCETGGTFGFFTAKEGTHER